MMTYFSPDGSYGDADGIEIIDTVYFTDEDWDEISNEIDYYRPALALEIAKKYPNA